MRIAKEACEGRSQNWRIGDFISYTLALLFQICYTGTKHIFLTFPANPSTKQFNQITKVSHPHHHTPTVIPHQTNREGYTKKLAEALQERADLNRNIEQLRKRLNSNVLVQEGERTAEEPERLKRELDASVERLAYLISRINLTNSQTKVDGSASASFIVYPSRLVWCGITVGV